jgi:hypothetical protein
MLRTTEEIQLTMSADDALGMVRDLVKAGSRYGTAILDAYVNSGNDCVRLMHLDTANVKHPSAGKPAAKERLLPRQTDTFAVNLGRLLSELIRNHPEAFKKPGETGAVSAPKPEPSAEEVSKRLRDRKFRELMHRRFLAEL